MKSVVLLSSGLDSTVNFYEALKSGEVKLALTFDYGQRAAVREIEKAQALAKAHRVPHQVLALPFFKDFGQSSLVGTSQSLPLGSDVSIDSLQVSQKTAKSVWVPNRNGIFMNIAAGFAEALGADAVIPGFNREEATTFPDNSEDFLRVLEKSFSYSTANHVRTHCFTAGLNKTEIVKRGLELKVDWKLVWPCYQALESWCGQCESCQRARRAFQANGLEFPQ
ncbi:MAG: 7-cyano-7-deazaguanine synthase QueC [Bdellovibrionales bacterium]